VNFCCLLKVFRCLGPMHDSELGMMCSFVTQKLQDAPLTSNSLHGRVIRLQNWRQRNSHFHLITVHSRWWSIAAELKVTSPTFRNSGKLLCFLSLHIPNEKMRTSISRPYFVLGSYRVQITARKRITSVMIFACFFNQTAGKEWSIILK
jgi:hypothetical protein